MKCIKDIKGKISRVSDEVAESLVKSTYYSYTNKKEWKEQQRPHSKARLTVHLTSDVSPSAVGEIISALDTIHYQLTGEELSEPRIKIDNPKENKGNS